MSSVPTAMCWMPSPLYFRRYSSIWLVSSVDSFSGMRILPQGEVMRAADQAGELAVDVEEVDLLEAEQLAVEGPPLVHVAAIDIVGQVVEIIEADAFRLRIALAQPVELGVVGRALLAVACRRNRAASRRCRRSPARRASCRRLHRASRPSTTAWSKACLASTTRQAIDGAQGPCSSTKLHGVRAGLGIEDVVDVALAPDGDVLGPVPGDRRRSPCASNSSASFSGSGCANSTNSKPSVPAGLSALIVGGRGVVRERTHGFLHRRLQRRDLCDHSASRRAMCLHSQRSKWSIDARIVHESGIDRMD